MKKFLNWFTAGFAAFFSIPTFLILISWNAVPGDSLYGLKIALEDVALAVTIRTPLASRLSVGYTGRRFSEANILLSEKGSTVGYSLLVSEANDSKNIIVDKQDSKQGAELVTKIEEYQRDIEEKQDLIRQGRLAVPVKSPSKAGTTFTPTPIPTTQPSTPVPTTQPPSVTSTPAPTPIGVIEAEENEEDVIEELEKAKKELEKVKDEVKKNLPEQAAEQAQDAVNDAQERQESKFENEDFEDDDNDDRRGNRRD